MGVLIGLTRSLGLRPAPHWRLGFNHLRPLPLRRVSAPRTASLQAGPAPGQRWMGHPRYCSIACYYLLPATSLLRDHLRIPPLTVCRRPVGLWTTLDSEAGLAVCPISFVSLGLCLSPSLDAPSFEHPPPPSPTGLELEASAWLVCRRTAPASSWPPRKPSSTYTVHWPDQRLGDPSPGLPSSPPRLVASTPPTLIPIDHGRQDPLVAAAEEVSITGRQPSLISPSGTVDPRQGAKEPVDYT